MARRKPQETFREQSVLLPLTNRAAREHDDVPTLLSLSSPIAMRRVASTPASFGREQQRRVGGASSSRRPLPLSPSSSVRSPGSLRQTISFSTANQKTTLHNNHNKPYALKRQASLPARTSTYKNRSYHPIVVEHDGDSVFSSESSLGEEEEDLEHRQIFRKNRLASPTSFRTTLTNEDSRGSSSLLQQGVLSLERIDTSQTDDEDEDDLIVRTATSLLEEDEMQEQLGSPRRRNTVVPEQEDAEHSTSTPDKNDVFLKRSNLQYIGYVSTFAVFGVVIRVFLGRLFGWDCEFDQEIKDWFSPLASRICVTASGTTEQRGGALFVDLPANMVGSFLMGLWSIQDDDDRYGSPIPWLKANHPLQQHDALHVAVKTGLCGSLTTFASWNAQMVVMLDGTQTELGAQVVPALFGYVLGMVTAVSSFLFGTHVSVWIVNRRNQPSSRRSTSTMVNNDTADEEHGTAQDPELAVSSATTGSPRRNVKSPAQAIVVFPRLGFHQSRTLRLVKWLCSVETVPFVVLVSLVVMFMVADFVWDIAFYRFLWLQVLFTPPGALLRWFLAARLNDNVSIARRWQWMPWGTLTANLVGSLISILMLALEFWYLKRPQGLSEWALSIIAAVRVGFAGSLSTVSTMANELVDTQNRFPNQAKSYHYGCITIITAMVLSLVVYIPIVRSS